MAGTTEIGGRSGSPWRVAAWTAAALALLTPLVAMQFTDEVKWDAADFAFAGVLIGSTGLAFELAARKTSNIAYRAGAAVGLMTAFLLVWVNAAVGVIGSEANPANLMYGGVLAVAALVALTARFQPRGMARAMFAAAVAQVAVAGIAFAAGWAPVETGEPGQLWMITGFFAALWLASAALFRRAASDA